MNRANLHYNIANQIPNSDNELAGAVFERTVTVTTAELLALFATPKELVPAPGAGKVLQFMGAVGFLDYNSATYTGNGNLTVNYSDGAGGASTAISDSVAAAALFHQADDCIEEFVPLSAETELIANRALLLVEAGGEATVGDSPIIMKVFYRILDFS